MSRGGRGGGRGRGGGGWGSRRGRGGRPDVPWSYDPDIKLDYKPSELFPVSFIRDDKLIGMVLMMMMMAG